MIISQVGMEAKNEAGSGIQPCYKCELINFV